MKLSQPTLKKTLLRKITWAVIILFVILAILPNLLNQAHIKAHFASLIGEKIGLDLAIGGLDISFGFRLKLESTNMVIKNSPPFTGQTFASAYRVSIEADWLPALLGQDISIKNLTLNGITLNLMTDKQGNTNWQDFFKPSNQKFKPGEPGKIAPSQVTINKLNIENAQVLWDNQQNGEQLLFSNIRIHGKEVALGNPVKIAITMDISGQPLNKPMKLTWSGVVTVDEAFDPILVTDSSLVLSGYQPKNPTETFSASVLLPKATITFTQQNVVTPSLELQLDELKLTVSDLNAEQITSKPSVDAKVTVGKFNPRRLAARWGWVLPATQDRNTLTEFAAAFALKANPEMIQLDALLGKLDNTNFSGTLRINNFKQPKTSFDISADTLNGDRYFPVAEKLPRTVSLVSSVIAFDIPAPPSNDLKHLNLDGKFRIDYLTAKGVTVKGAKLSLWSNRGKINIEQIGGLQ